MGKTPPRNCLVVARVSCKAQSLCAGSLRVGHPDTRAASYDDNATDRKASRESGLRLVSSPWRRRAVVRGPVHFSHYLPSALQGTDGPNPSGAFEGARPCAGASQRFLNARWQRRTLSVHLPFAAYFFAAAPEAGGSVPGKGCSTGDVSFAAEGFTPSSFFSSFFSTSNCERSLRSGSRVQLETR